MIHVAETCHPDNQLNLITDVAVAPNNTDDSEILADRVETMQEQTPDLTELHTDAGYASDDTDQMLQDAEITLIQTAIKGRTADVQLQITPLEEDGYQVTCPAQTVRAQRTPKRWKAEFDWTVCADCPVQEQCPTIVGKAARRWYFDAHDAQRHARWQRWAALPEERQTLRPNVEATVKEMQRAMPHKQLNVRGAFATATYAVLRAIGVNFGRISRFLADPDTAMTLEQLQPRLAGAIDHMFRHCWQLLTEFWGVRWFFWKMHPYRTF